MPSETLLELLEEAARTLPDAPAFSAPGRASSGWKTILEHVNGVRRRVAAAGLGSGERLVIAVPDGVDAAVALLASSCVCVAVPIPAATPEDEAARLLARLGARAVLVLAGAPTPMAAVARSQGLRVLEIVPQAGAGVFSFADQDGHDLAPHAPTGGDVAVLLHTSGTTSESRRVAFTHAQLCQVGREGVELLSLTPDDASLCFAPTFHLAGLYYAVVYPLSSRAPVFVTPGFDPARFFDWFSAARPTFFGGSPTAHQAIADAAAGHADTIRAGRLRLIRSAAALLKPADLARIERIFGVPVLDGYALTEAGLVASARPDPASRKPGTVGRAFAGAEIRIADDAGTALPVGQAGEVLVRSHRVMREYDGDPEATRAAFHGDWLRTGDEGFLDAEGFLTITGRLRERLNRGGEKVSPQEVDEVLLAHPGVAGAAAFGIPHARLGEDLAAVVVPRPGVALDAADVRAFVAQRLAPFKVPSRVLVRDRIPRGATGKIPRRRLHELLGLQETAAPVPPAGPERARESRVDVAHVIALELGRVLDRPVAPDDDFFELGGDSLSAVALMRRLDVVLGSRLAATALFAAPSPRALAARLASEGGTDWGPLVPFRATGSGAPLFFVHALGGGVLFFARLAAHLEGRPFFGLQAPGFDGADAPLAEIPAIAARYVAAVRGRQPRGPYRLGGFCMGAAIAMEMARQLEADGERVDLLALLDPPPLPLGARRHVGDRARVAISAAWNRLRGREPGPPIAAHEPAVVRAHRLALRRYRPGRVAAPLALFFAEGGSREPALEAEHALRRLTSGRVDVATVTAGHKGLFEEPAIGQLAARIEARLAALPG